MMANFWDEVVGPALFNAADEIGKYKQAKLDARQQEFIRQQARVQAQREHEEFLTRENRLGLQGAETGRHNLAMEGANERRFGLIDQRQAEIERHNREMESRPTAQESRIPPNFIEDISTAADQAVGRNASIRQDEGNTYINGSYGRITTPQLTRPQAIQQQFDLRKGMMGLYNVKPDSVATGLGLSTNAPRMRSGAPSSGVGDLRMLDRQRGFGPDGSFPTEQEYLEAKAMGIVQ